MKILFHVIPILLLILTLYRIITMNEKKRQLKKELSSNYSEEKIVEYRQTSIFQAVVFFLWSIVLIYYLYLFHFYSYFN